MNTDDELLLNAFPLLLLLYFVRLLLLLLLSFANIFHHEKHRLSFSRLTFSKQKPAAPMEWFYTYAMSYFLSFYLFRSYFKVF